MTIDRRGLLAGVGGLSLAGAARAEVPLELTGRFQQGGHAIGRTTPRAMIYVDGEALTQASAAGWFFVGFDRDAAASAEIVARDGRAETRRRLELARGTFPTTRVDGLPPATVAPEDPAVLERIQREVAIKAEGFASRVEGDDFRDGFHWPLETVRVTSAWGSQRILNGTPTRPHYGIDLGAAAGTAIRAPAAGTVTLAERDLHFEGGLTLIDHGQGLISACLHQSRLEVAKGDRVRRGEIIGRVGSSGRATGPHLCWRLKWRDRNLDPSLMVRP
ncbi:MAG TPA: M23 family metallopeptidase [Brevundimonas sp.]|uniref:M23 family metallopeptidase n=1 Tax=Brevundimonas sp. TaxID=1871086 RepID=UPI002DE6510A|nr:M23 family metallopeptidase [Brevundimonas sp.]